MANSRAAWMRQGRYGLMVRPVPAERAAADAFDPDRFMADFRRTGAAWLIFPLDPRSGDDLAGEIAVRARRACRKFIAYLPLQIHDQPRDAGRIREYALRYGDLLDGWWFDGAAGADLQTDRYLTAARAGNPAAAVAFNDGSFGIGSDRPVSADQDYLSGETEALVGGKVRFGRDLHAPLLDPATHDPQPPPGCLWHALIPIDCNWIHGAPPAPGQPVTFTYMAPDPAAMEPPMYRIEDLATVVRDFKAAGGAVTFNACIFPEGGLGADTVAQLADLSRTLSTRRG